MDIEKKISIKNFIKDLTVSEVVDFFGSLKNVSKILGYESILNLYGATDNGHPDYMD
jgi:ABC-type multidrug transport system ATPase subunit